MKILKKIGKWFLVLLGAFIAFILVVLLIIRINSSGNEEPFLDEKGNVLPNSIAMHEDMLINGAPQRITIRGKDKNNPVLLIVHGGPGYPFLPVFYKLTGADLEDIFTVCYWDQRGSGLAAVGIILPFILSFLFTTVTGSITVSLITTASIMAPMVTNGSLHPELTAAAIGAGSLGVIHVNSSFFWLFKEVHEVSTAKLLKSLSVLTIVVALSSGLMVCLLYYLKLV